MILFTRIRSWVLFILLAMPMLAPAIAFWESFNLGLLLYLVFLFSYNQWISSVGRFAAIIRESEDGVLHVLFLLAGRLVFLLPLLALLSIRYISVASSGVVLANLSTVFIIGTWMSFIYLVIYSSVLLEQLSSTVSDKRKIFLNGVLFIFFPIGVWFLQPKINRLIGDQL